MQFSHVGFWSATTLAAIVVTGCATAIAPEPAGETVAVVPSNFEQDRQSILAMAGDYKVTFDFTETVSFVEG